jgi:hypothetical protein
VNYKDKLKIVEKNSINLGLLPHLDLRTPSTAEKIWLMEKICSGNLQDMLVQRYAPGYWGQQCLNVTSQSFAILQSLDIPCELVFGEVNINGTNEFDTTLEGLMSEYEKGYSGTAFAVHVWLNIGKDYIVDPTISSRIHKYYDKNFPQNKVINGTANKLDKKMKLKYIPMLAGVKYLEKTCGIPLEYVTALYN